LDVPGWSFDRPDGRAIEERPPWASSQRLASRLAEVESVLDIGTGDGESVA
jgi:hypothetical protein